MSNRYKIVYSLAAKSDIRNISAYILYELRSPQAARNMVTRIRNEIRSLSSMPERYALVEWEPWASRMIHRVSVGHYVIFYAVEEGSRTVTVVRIFYGGRDIEGIISGSE